MIGVVRPTPLSLLPGRLVRGCRLDRSPSGPGRDPVFTDSPQRPRGPLHTAVRTCLRIRVNTGQCVALSTRGRSRGRRLTPRLWRRAAFRKRPTQPGARGPSRSPAPLPALPPSAAPGGHASSLRHSLLVQARLRRPPGVAAGATPTPHVAPQSCSALRASSSSTNGRGHSVWPLRKRDCISKIHKGYSGNQYKNVNSLRIFLPRGRDTG